MTSGPLLEHATISSRKQIAPGFWFVGIRSPRIARRVRPAQYAAIDLPGEFEVRLPLGIWTVDDGEISFLFREWGPRTEALARAPGSSALSLVGPLGNEFSIPRRGARATIVAGGLGVVPFWLLAKELLMAGVRTTVILGARSADQLVGAEQLRGLGVAVEICTDDGSAGSRGTVIDHLIDHLRKGPRADILYGCGPPGMLRALCEFAETNGMPCEISMEETFGCSMGTCWGCVVPVRRGCSQATGYPKASGETRDYDFARVCADGTVFKAADVLWQR